MKKIKRKYSGGHSKEFWQRVNEHSNPLVWDLACQLQSLEEKVLKVLNDEICEHKWKLVRDSSPSYWECEICGKTKQ